MRVRSKTSTPSRPAPCKRNAPPIHTGQPAYTDSCWPTVHYSMTKASSVVPSARAMRVKADVEPGLRPHSISDR